MTPKRSTNEVYGDYVSGVVSLAETAALLREHTRDKPLVTGSLELDQLPSDRREKAGILLDELIGPACRRFISGDTVDAAVDEIAPFLLPHGLFALNVSLPGGAGPAAVSRLAELMARLIEVFDGLKSGDR